MDEPVSPGGAELTQAEFRAATPEGVQIVDCPPGNVDDTCDRYVIHNCVQYTLKDLRRLEGRPVLKYHHDVGPWILPEVREWLDHNTQAVCCSPIQAAHMALPDAALIPPAVDLARFTDAADKCSGRRTGAVSVGSWRNFGKAPHKAAEWGARNGGIDFFGSGPLAPPGSVEVPYDDVPTLLSTYETFVFLPSVLEPFGRLIAEAWAAGCRIVTNELVGAGYWIREQPEAIESAAQDFWAAALAQEQVAA